MATKDDCFCLPFSSWVAGHSRPHVAPTIQHSVFSKYISSVILYCAYGYVERVQVPDDEQMWAKIGVACFREECVASDRSDESYVE